MKTFTDLSTRTKLMLSFGLIILMFLAAIFIANNNIKQIIKSETHLFEVNFKLALQASTLRSNVNNNRAALLEMILTKDKTKQLSLELEMNSRADSIDKIAQNLIMLNDDPLFKSKLDEFKEIIDLYRKTRTEQIALIKAGKNDEAAILGTGIQNERYGQIRLLTLEISRKAQEDAIEHLKIDIKDGNNTIFFFYIFGIAAVIFSIIIILVMNKTIISPLIELTDLASKISSGNLKIDFEGINRKDEIGKLSMAFSQMVKYLRQFINEINEGVNTLASASSQILAATTQVATGTAETATAISETSTTVEEVQQASKQASLIAKNVSDSAQRVVQVSQSGKKAVDETINGMNKIREQMDSIAQTVVRLSEQSQSIGGIIASVTDIADQSNLLSVNAAIEAAKAGDQGKGFAVVAQEIKNLAGQSKQSTLEVRNILNDIQKATSAAVLATEQGSNAVTAGLKQSILAGEAIQILSESSNEASQSSAQIVASSQQQVVGMDQISIAMQNINQAGTETAVSMVQAEKSARNLYELGQKLKKQTEKFNT